MPAKHYFTLSVRDFSGETSPVQFYHGPVTAGNIAGYLTSLGAVRNAVDAVTSGVIAKEKWVGDDTTLSQLSPNNPASQRELKVLVSYQGNTNLKRYTLTIPSVDTSVAGFVPNSDLIDMTAEPWATLKSQLESFCRTPDNDAETITILSMRVVGRNI